MPDLKSRIYLRQEGDSCLRKYKSNSLVYFRKHATLSKLYAAVEKNTHGFSEDFLHSMIKSVHVW